MGQTNKFQGTGVWSFIKSERPDAGKAGAAKGAKRSAQEFLRYGDKDPNRGNVGK